MLNSALIDIFVLNFSLNMLSFRLYRLDLKEVLVLIIFLNLSFAFSHFRPHYLAISLNVVWANYAFSSRVLKI